MKKYIALFLVLVLVFAVTPSILAKPAPQAANRNTDANRNGNAVRLTAEETQETIERIEEYENEKTEEKPRPLFARRQEGPRYKNRNKTRERAIVIQERYRKAKQKYIAAKERYLIAKERYINARRKLAEARRIVMRCKGDESAECVAARTEIKHRAKEFLLKVANRTIRMLERAKTRVEATEMAEERAAEIIAILEEKIAAVQDAAQATVASETKEEILEAARTIRQIWRGVHGRILWAIGRTINARIAGILQKSEQLSERLERTIKRLEEQGIDITELQALVESFNELIELAKEEYKKARELFEQALTADIVPDIMREAHQHVKAAHRALKEAHKILIDIIHKIKEAKGEVIEEEPEETEKPEEPEETEETEEIIE